MAQFIPSYTAEELAYIQENGLRWTVLHAYAGGSQYRKKLQAHGVNPTAIENISDLQLLPFTTVDDLREGYPLPLLCVPENEVVRIHASSGTTDKRKILAYTQKDVDTFNLQMARCFEMAHLTPQDRVQIAVGYGLWTAGVGFQSGCERFGAMAIPVGAGNLDIHLQMLTDFKTTCLCCTASMALLMSEEVQRHNLLEHINLQRIIFGAEGHTPKMRHSFQQKLGITESFDIGGMTEMYGPGSSLECIAHQGLHYWADLFIFEIIDPKTLQPVATGEIGELVVTTLCKEAVPLIRYRTGDLTRFLPGTCSCGCTMPRHDHLLGRADDMIIFRGVNIYPSQLAEIFAGFTDLGSEYHIFLARNGDGRDTMTLQIERAEHATNDNDASLVEQITKKIQAKVLISAKIAIANPGELPRSFGKSQRVTDSRFGS